MSNQTLYEIAKHNEAVYRKSANVALNLNYKLIKALRRAEYHITAQEYLDGLQIIREALKDLGEVTT